MLRGVAEDRLPRRRMPPDARREQILDVAAELFADRPFTTVSTGEVAEAAGVARSLVHHYFGGIRELFLAVANRGVGGIEEIATAGPEMPVGERISHNLAIGMKMIDANRQTWLAVFGQAGSFGDPELAALLASTNEQTIERSLVANADILRDTPKTRFVLRCFQAFMVEATRAWLSGEVAREECERVITLGLNSMLLDVIPAYEDH